MKPVTLSWQSANDIQAAAQILRSDNVLIGDSDTVLGFLAPLTTEGFLSLNAIKKRTEKPYLILSQTVEKALAFMEFTTSTQRDHVAVLARACWPGPLTLVAPAHASLPSYCTSVSGTVGIRVPDHAGLQMLLRSFGGLFSTSANEASKPISRDFQASTTKQLIQQCAAIIMDQGEPANGLPSTIVDVCGDEPVIIRHGAINKEKIHSVWNNS